MKILILGAIIFVLGTTSAFANITCWYNAQGHYTGADDAQPNFPVGKVTNGNGGDYAYGYTVTGGPDTCPKKLPGH